MEASNRGWILIALLIAVGLALAIFFASQRRVQQVQAQDANVQLNDVYTQVRRLQEENDQLREMLDRSRDL